MWRLDTEVVGDGGPGEQAVGDIPARYRLVRLVGPLMGVSVWLPLRVCQVVPLGPRPAELSASGSDRVPTPSLSRAAAWEGVDRHRAVHLLHFAPAGPSQHSPVGVGLVTGGKGVGQHADPTRNVAQRAEQAAHGCEFAGARDRYPHPGAVDVVAAVRQALGPRLADVEGGGRQPQGLDHAGSHGAVVVAAVDGGNHTPEQGDRDQRELTRAAVVFGELAAGGGNDSRSAG